MKKKILLSGGGTGGHIYPALAIADELKSRFPEIEICFAGTKDGLESTIIPQRGYPLKFVRSAGIERRFTVKNIKNFSLAVAGMKDASKLLNEFKPDLVVGTGGYASAPILFLAGLKKIPILLQEQNAILGITNRIVQRFAQRIALGAPGAVHSISGDRKRAFVTGNPVRPEFLQITREEAREKLGLKEQEKLIVLTGGSRGARNLNQNAVDLHRWAETREDVRLIHVTGSSQWEDFRKILENLSLETESSKRKVVHYLENMPEVLRAADLIISRSGALALAEIAVCGLPSILIPYPYAAEDHQTANARDFVEAEAAILISDRELTGQQLVDEATSILDNKDRWQQMSQGALSLARPEAATQIADLAVDLIKGVE